MTYRMLDVHGALSPSVTVPDAAPADSMPCVFDIDVAAQSFRDLATDGAFAPSVDVPQEPPAPSIAGVFDIDVVPQAYRTLTTDGVLIDQGPALPPSSGGFLLLNDGVSHLLLAGGTGALLLEA